MEARHFELAIYGTISTLGVTAKVIDFLGRNSLSRRYVGTRTKHTFYLFALHRPLGVSSTDPDEEVWHSGSHRGVEQWEWWTSNDDIGGTALPRIPRRPGCCDLCNSGPPPLQWKRVVCVDMSLLRYVPILPSNEEVAKRIDSHWYFRSRWVCPECSIVFVCDDHFPLGPVDF